jgi:hypothetical protein
MCADAGIEKRNIKIFFNDGGKIESGIEND